MDKFRKEITLALMLGSVLPWLTLSLGRFVGRPGPEPTVPSGTQPQTVPTQTEAAAPQSPVIYIPVETETGKWALMELENYVLGVVLAEMPASFEEEALKAQAVAARTYTLRRLAEGGRHNGAAVCADPECCQAYISEADYLADRGTRADTEKIRAAVEKTHGMILTYGGQPIEATYFSCSGGRTESAEAVWGTEIPYLQSVDSPGEEGARNYLAQVYFSAEEFRAALGRNLTGNPEDWFRDAVITEGGGVRWMTVGGIRYSGTQLRTLLGLNSTAFELRPGEYGVTAVTRGKGHRVGMSQYGADAMAVLGSGWEEILMTYYPGTGIDKIGNIG